MKTEVHRGTTFSTGTADNVSREFSKSWKAITETDVLATHLESYKCKKRVMFLFSQQVDNTQC